MPLPVLWNASEFRVDTDRYNFNPDDPTLAGNVAITGGGSVALIRKARTDISPFAFDIFIREINALGEPVGIEKQVSSDTNANGFAYDADIVRTPGGYAVVTSRFNNASSPPFDMQVEFFSSVGSRLAEYTVTGMPFGAQDVEVATLNNGNLAVAFASGNNGGIWTYTVNPATGFVSNSLAAAFSSYGALFTYETPKIVSMSGGGYAVVAKGVSGVDANIHGAIFDANGNRLGSPFSVGSSLGTADPDIIQMTNGMLVVSWFDTSMGQSRAQIVTTGGLKIGGGINFGMPGFVSAQADLLAMPDGGFIAVFKDLTGAVLAELFSPTGQSLGEMTVEPPPAASINIDPEVTLLDDGRLSVIWKDLNNGELEARIIDPRGAATINGTSGDDVLFGSELGSGLGATGKLLIGGGGNDVIYAGNGDTVRGGAGNDILFANPSGGRYPTLDFSDAASGVVVDANAGTASGASTGNDFLFGVFTNIIGGSGNDIIAAFDQASANGLTTLDGGAGDDIFRRLQFTKAIIGGDGIDTMDAWAVSDENPATPGVTIELEAETWIAHGIGDVVGRTVSGVENVIGTSDRDTITGSYLANVLDGGTGNDIINGGEGNDTLIGGAGNDNLNGGDDIDTLSYAAATGAITITLAASSLQNVGGGQGSDTISNIENLIGSSFNDLLNGNLLSNTIWGGNGDDRLFGNNDDDTLYGEAGNDQLIGSTGADTLVGGVGNDRYFVDSIIDEIVEVAGQGIDYVYTTGDYTLGEGVDIEYFYVANSTDGLELTGNSAGNIIYGSISATVGDTLSGAGGADALYGQAGGDRLDGGEGIDSYFGGAGADVFVLQNTFAGRDLLRDFVGVDDQLEVSRSVFGNFDNAGAVAAADWFVSNTTGRAADSNDRFIYNSTIGYLYFDADGNGAGARVLVARITNLEAIAAADFNVVA